MPGAGCAMPRFTLFLLLVVLCSIALCCVVSCSCRWVVVSRVVCRCWVTPVFVQCRLVVRYRVLPWYCVARHSVLRCAGSCRGGGICCVWLLLVVVLTLCVVVCGCSAWWRVVFCVGSRWVPPVAPTFALLCCAVCRCVRVLGCVFRGVRFRLSRWGCFGVGFCLVALCVLACVALWCAVLSRCVLVRWVGRWCVASGTVVRCCVLLFVGWLRCITRCVAHRCFAVGCGVVFRVVGFVVVCCVSVLRGLVVLSCWLRYVAPLWCHVAMLGDVVGVVCRGSPAFLWWRVRCGVLLCRVVLL